MNKPIDAGKIRWKCRRGMLELDIILERFYNEKFQVLTNEEKELFNRLLDAPDPILYEWLLGYTVPNDSELKKLVDKILH